MNIESKRTPLYNLHQELKAKMVPFAGYEMPLQYAKGIKHEHTHTRKHAGLFDISHMGQVRIYGDAAITHFETLVPGDISGLKEYQQLYTVLTNSEGGIIDDVMVTKMPDHLFVVINAACKETNLNYLRSTFGSVSDVIYLEAMALIALQGPQAASAMNKFISDISDFNFMSAKTGTINSIPCLISRSGYTGEDGFEISVTAEQAESLAWCLLKQEGVEPVGLGARDSLRLEAGLCLYGHDIDEITTPIEAGLGWVIAKKYRENPELAHFPGAEKIFSQLQQGTNKLRVGLQPEGAMPIREGAILYNSNDQEVGHITSGGFGPSVGKPVAMGYVDKEYAKSDTVLHTEVRGRQHTIKIVDLPFVKRRYYKRQP